jgi:hypothetical protein
MPELAATFSNGQRGKSTMFDAQGNYSPPDAPARFVLVVTKTHVGFLGQARRPITVPAGTVLDVVTTLGYTNIAAGQGPHYLHPQAGATLIEHATAKPAGHDFAGDVLSAAEVTAGVALMAKRKAAIEAFRAAEAAKPQPPTLEQRVATLEAKVHTAKP